jgi:hypothetical protein
MDRTDTSPRTDPGRTGSRSGARTTGLPSRLLQVVLPALVLAVIAGAGAGAVTLVNLASAVEGPSPAEEEGSSAGAGDAPQGADQGDATSEEDVPDEHDATRAALAFAEAVSAHGLPDYSAILTRRYPGAQWSLSGNDPNGLVWSGPGERPTQEELDAHWPSVAAELAAEQAERAALKAAEDAARTAELDARRDDPEVKALLDRFDPRTIWGPDPDYSHVLSRRFPGAQWSLNGNDPVGGLTWMGPGPRPTKAELDALWAEVAREMALEMDPRELERWAGTGDQVYVDGVLRPKGWVGGANDPQPAPVADPKADYRYLPQIAPTNGGSPVGSIDILRDPTGGQNFEQRYGIDLTELAARIAEAHGYFGGSHGLGLGLNGDRELLWYSDQVDPGIVQQVLSGIGALPPGPEPDHSPTEGAGSTEGGSSSSPDDHESSED